MRAILVLSGRLLDIYALERHGRNEVTGFLKVRDDPATASCVRGFLAIIGHMADEGTYKLTPEMRRCWKEDGIRICELRKEPWRFSYFTFDGDRILLTTVFRKTKRKQKEEYKRAIGYFLEFSANPIFEEVKT